MATYLQETERQLLLGNDQVELAIDRATGYFGGIRNKLTGLQHKTEAFTGSWPFGLRLGKPGWPDLQHVQIRPDGFGRHPQKMTYQVQEEKDGSAVVTLVYKDLLTLGGAATGVRLEVQVRLGGEDFFLITARVANHGRYEITTLASGAGDFVAAENREQEKLAAPTWHFGGIWENPHKHFAERETFGHPIFGSYCGLDAEWFDLYGPAGGIGVGYINRQGMTMYHNVQRGAGGMQIGWQLFNVTHEKAQNKWGVVGCVAGLEPGQTYETGTWILAPHEGDWHRMADIYRGEYLKAFAGDTLTWELTRPEAKEMDLYMLMSLEGKTFADVPGTVRVHLEQLEADAGNLSVLLWGTGEKFPRHMPDHLPCRADKGGDAGAARMCRDLRAMGMRAIIFYAHLFYNHPKAVDYVAAADTGMDHSNDAWPEIGNVACADHDDWQRLWREKYVPGYEALGAGGMVLDQGPTQYIVCPRDDHGHDRAVERLTSHMHGINRLIRSLREGFSPAADPQAMIITEVGNDVQTRWVDVWECPAGSFYSPGALQTRQIVRYTLPWKLGLATAAATPAELTAEAINDILVNGLILMLGVQAGPNWIYHEATPAALAAARQFVRLRRDLRRRNAPGFPNGFRDITGIQVGDDRLVAKSYTDGAGITVVFYAREAVQTTLTVDPAALGCPGSPKTHAITLDKDQAGFVVMGGN